MINRIISHRLMVLSSHTTFTAASTVNTRFTENIIELPNLTIHIIQFYRNQWPMTWPKRYSDSVLFDRINQNGFACVTLVDFVTSLTASCTLRMLKGYLTFVLSSDFETVIIIHF